MKAKDAGYVTLGVATFIVGGIALCAVGVYEVVRQLKTDFLTQTREVGKDTWEEIQRRRRVQKPA